jgi:hypothetical protein
MHLIPAIHLEFFVLLTKESNKEQKIAKLLKKVEVICKNCTLFRLFLLFHNKGKRSFFEKLDFKSIFFLFLCEIF